MSARDELPDIKSRAEKFIAAHDEMIRIGQGIGGLAVKRPDLMPDFDAWWHASEVEHADTVLAVIEALKPKVLGYIVVDRGGIMVGNQHKYEESARAFAADWTKECKDAGIDWDYRVAAITEVQA